MWTSLGLVVLCASPLVAQRPLSSVPPETPACAFSASDQAWVERSIEAWYLAAREIAHIARPPSYRAILFDGSCVLSSEDALTSFDGKAPTWKAAPHGGAVAMPDGTELPVGVASFTSGKDGAFWLVMSTPSVWQAGGIGKGDELATTMVAVLLHEASHVAQLTPYGRRLDKLIADNGLPDTFGDDAVQDRFRSNPEFAASIARETAKFLQAAAQEDDGEARLLVYEGREMMQERAARWFVGEDAYLAEAEDLWLTFEGAGQWVGYQWLIHPQGGGKEPEDVLPTFARDPSWVQGQGFALVMALDRIAGPDWKRHAFGDGAQTVLEMLDAALED